MRKMAYRTRNQDDDVSSRDHCEFLSSVRAPFSEQRALTEGIDEVKSTVAIKDLDKRAG